MIRLIALFLFIAFSILGADIVGTWKARHNNVQGQHEFALIFRLDDGKLTGSIDDKGTRMPIVGVTMDGDKINFRVEHDQEKFLFSGRIAGDEMTLTATHGDQSIDISATRMKE